MAGERDLVSHSRPNKELAPMVCEFDSRAGEQPPAVCRVITDRESHGAVSRCILAEGIDACPDAPVFVETVLIYEPESETGAVRMTALYFNAAASKHSDVVMGQFAMACFFGRPDNTWTENACCCNHAGKSVQTGFEKVYARSSGCYGPEIRHGTNYET